jgi:catechol 2,3-dioxygenase-like lactoylglutathione lyase family enzyme
VLNVRDIEEPHYFYTEILGLKQVGQLTPRPERPNPLKMRFYSGDRGGKMNHHDIALVENPNLPPPPANWAMFGVPVAISHVAIALPGREAWLKQLAYLQSRGIEFKRRVNHGMTHSLYISDPNGSYTSCRVKCGKATSTPRSIGPRASRPRARRPGRPHRHTEFRQGGAGRGHSEITFIARPV